MKRIKEYSLHNSPANSSMSSEMPEPYTFYDKQRETACLKGFKNLYESQLLFDVTLSVEGRQFRCHRALLASSSDYFRAMFTDDLAERNQNLITISGMDAMSMELILHYLYTAECKLQSDTAQNLLSAANLLQLLDLRDGCASYMVKQLDTDNCLGIHFFAQAHDCDTLQFQAREILIESFDSVSQSNEFLELNHENLVEILGYDDILVTEEEMFEASTRWLHHDLDSRQVHLAKVFSKIRFALLDRHFFYDKVRSSQVLMSNHKLRRIFEEVLRYKLLSSRWMEVDLRLEPRYGSDWCRLVVYTSYQDDEKKQVLQLYGSRSDEVTSRNGSILCDLPADVENPALLVTGENDLYIGGGDSCGAAMYKWVTEDDDFEEVAPLPDARKQFCLVEVDECIYAVGGCNHEGNLASVVKYCHQNDVWHDVAPLPKAVRCLCAVAYHGKLYVFGGESEKMNKKVARGKRELSRQAFCYDPREDKWCHLAYMNTARALAGCTVFRNNIYVIGGFGTITDSWIKDKSPESSLKSVEIYNPEADTWYPGPDLPVQLCAMGVIKYNSSICVLGGENDEDVSSEVYQLSENGKKWEHKGEMVTGVTETSLHSAYAVMNIDMYSEAE